MIISREVDINVNRYGLRVVIPVVQYDSGRQIIFNIVDAELPSGCTSNIFIRKPSGKSVYNACTVSGNKVTVTLTNQSLSEYGFNDAQIQIIKGEEVVTSFSFILEVKQSDADNAVISKSESTFFQGLVSKAQAVAKTCTEVADSIPSDYSKLSKDVAVLNNTFVWKDVYIVKVSTSLEEYVLNHSDGVFYAWSTSSDANSVGAPTSASYHYVIVKTTATTAVIYATIMGQDIIYVKQLYGGGAWGSWTKLPERSEVDSNTTAIATLNSSLGHINARGNIIPTDTTIEDYADTLNIGFYIVSANSSSTAVSQGFPIATPFTIHISVYARKEHIQMIAEPFNPTAGIGGDTLYIKRKYGGTWHEWIKLPARSEIDANTTKIATLNTNLGSLGAAIDNVKTDLLGGYKLVGYTASVAMPSAGEYIIPYSESALNTKQIAFI